jgi:hypothetical protein
MRLDTITKLLIYPTSPRVLKGLKRWMTYRMEYMKAVFTLWVTTIFTINEVTLSDLVLWRYMSDKISIE